MATTPAAVEAAEDEKIFTPVYLRANKFCIGILFAHFALALALAPFYDTWMIMLAIGAPTILISALMWRLIPVAALTRITIGIAFQVFTALHIYQMHGLPEMHFFFFTGVTAMIIYQDIGALIPGTVLIVLQHIVFALLSNVGYRIYFFQEGRVGVLKLAFHFGIASVQVLMAGYAMYYLRGRTLAAYHEAANARRRRQSLATVLSEVQKAVRELASSSREVQNSSESLSQRAKDEVESVQRTAASLQEMSAAMEQTAENSRLARALSETASGLARNGSESMGQSATAMAELEIASNKVSGLVDTLNEIAFQTNVLSVNAAIEAAIAGEHGRSFAVVSTEVRQLAGKSADAARDARTLIEESFLKIRDSAKSVSRSSELLTDLAGNSRKVSLTITEISDASREQASAIQEISRAIGVLDQGAMEITAQTGTMLATSKSLALIAGKLGELVTEAALD